MDKMFLDLKEEIAICEEEPSVKIENISNIDISKH